MGVSHHLRCSLVTSWSFEEKERLDAGISSSNSLSKYLLFRGLIINQHLDLILSEVPYSYKPSVIRATTWKKCVHSLNHLHFAPQLEHL